MYSQYQVTKQGGDPQQINSTSSNFIQFHQISTAKLRHWHFCSFLRTNLQANSRGVGNREPEFAPTAVGTSPIFTRSWKDVDSWATIEWQFHVFRRHTKEWASTDGFNLQFLHWNLITQHSLITPSPQLHRFWMFSTLILAQLFLVSTSLSHTLFMYSFPVPFFHAWMVGSFNLSETYYSIGMSTPKIYG